jgi:hypothetical protein
MTEGPVTASSAFVMRARIARLMLAIGAALILVALVTGFWPSSVRFNGVSRACSPDVGNFVPSDPGPATRLPS